MQISVSKHSPGYKTYQEYGGADNDWRVTVDGRRVSKVVDVDIDAGNICRYATDAVGEIVVRDGYAVFESMSGDVQVEVRRRSDGALLHRLAHPRVLPEG